LIKIKQKYGCKPFLNVKNIPVDLSFRVKIFLKVSKKKKKITYMSKNETKIVRLLFFILAIAPLHAEITIGLLSSIESNAKQTLLYQNRVIPCEPFGIVTLEKMVQNGASPQECKKAVETFYASHPHRRQFAREHLILQQSYHYETIPEGCVLYANGTETYSEMLLRNGLALVDPAFDQNEWNAKLKRAEAGAEKESQGLHETLIRKWCIKEEK
jgi:hypothetical protein